MISVKLLNPFFAVASQISADLTIRFNIEKDVKKLFENIMRIKDQAVREDVERNPPRLKAVFHKTLKLTIIYIHIQHTRKQQKVLLLVK